jgi:hypothetical protein
VEVGVDVLGAIEDIGGADDVVEKGIGRGNARTDWKMIDELRGEERFRGELFDFLAVFRVIGNGARFGLNKAGRGEQTQGEQNTGENSSHRAPQGTATAGIIQLVRQETSTAWDTQRKTKSGVREVRVIDAETSLAYD